MMKRVLLTLLFIMLALVIMTRVDIQPANDGVPAYFSWVTRSQVPSAGIWCVAYTGISGSPLPGGIVHRCGASYLSPSRIMYACSVNLPPSITGFPQWYNCGPS